MKLTEALKKHETLKSLLEKYKTEAEKIEKSDDYDSYAGANQFGITSAGWAEFITSIEVHKSEILELIRIYGDVDSNKLNTLENIIENDARFDYDTQNVYCRYAAHAKKYVDKIKQL